MKTGLALRKRKGGGIVKNAIFAVAAALVVGLPCVVRSESGGMIVLQTGSDWCESGEDVRKVFESTAFRRALVRRGGYDLAVYDDMERPTPKVAAANKTLEKSFVRSSRLPAISFLSPQPRRFFALIENIPYDITPQELAKRVNDALASRKEVEALFKQGARQRMSNPEAAAAAYGAGFEILAKNAGDLNEGRTRKGAFAYEEDFQMLLKLDAGDRFGWRMRFESGYGFGIVEKANKMKGTGYLDEQKKYIASLRAIPTNHLTVVQRQCIEMAEYAILREGGDSARAKTVLKNAFAMGRDTVWGQCAMGYLILSGEYIERKPKYRATVRSRPGQGPQMRPFNPSKLTARIEQIGADAELTEAQKTDIVRYTVLQRVGIDEFNELIERPGAWPFIATFIKDRQWMEDFVWSGPCDSRALFALESLVYQDNGRWINGDGPGRRFATALALEYPKGDEEWLADYLDAYRETAKAKRLHRHALTQPVWQWRYALAPRGSINTDDPPNQQRFMEKFCNMKVGRNGGAHWFVPYRLFNCFGESVHSPEYYKPWVTAGEWPKRKYTYIVGGVCGELSTFGSICSAVHGLPAITCGQPGHCAYTRRILNGTWHIDNNIAPPTTMRTFWPNGGRWTYLQADEGTFEGDREKRLNADRFVELARFAEDKERPAEEVSAFYARACREWPTHYGAWRAWGDWIVRAGRPLGEYRKFAHAAVAALKGLRQPLWDLLTPYYRRVVERKGVDVLAVALIELAPALRQDDGRIQEEGDFRAAVAKWAAPIAENPALMEQVSMAVLTAQSGTRNYFAQALAWCGDFIIDDEKRLAKLLDLASTTSKSKKKGAVVPQQSFLAPLILSASVNGNLSVFQKLSAMQDKLAKYKPKGKRYTLHDFDAELISAEGLLRTSSSPHGDTPGAYAHALDGRPCTGNAFKTDKEKTPWAMVMLPKPAAVKGVVVVDAGKDNKARSLQTPLEVALSEDGQNWQTVHTESEPRDMHRVDLRKNRNKYLFVRVRRSPDVLNEPFSLAKILVYGRK